jgi:hypothetical protein
MEVAEKITAEVMLAHAEFLPQFAGSIAKLRVEEPVPRQP